MDSIISVVSGGGGDILAYTTALFSDFWVLIALAVGIPLAFLVIKRVLNVMPKK